MTHWQRIALVLYSALLNVLLPVLLLRLRWRGRSEPLYRRFWRERLGIYPSNCQPTSGWVWLHAVSLGETRAATALIDALRQEHPHLKLLLTHGTATGRTAGAELLLAGDHQCWVPFDTLGASRRFLCHYRPQIGILMETEIWPSLLYQAQQLGVPMVCANARLSEKSLRQGQRFAVLLRPAVSSVHLILAQTQADAHRFSQAGAAHVVVCGNLKFDAPLDAVKCDQGRAWRQHDSRLIVLAASTREGEEAALLAAWSAHPLADQALLVIVPRHPQRFDEVAQLIQASGFSTVRRSAWTQIPPTQAALSPIWLGDTLGEMPLYYSFADVALLGGSFAPLGGQNLIEAAACGCPMLMGPHTFNFTQAAEQAEQAGAAYRMLDWAQALDWISAHQAQLQSAVQKEHCLDFAFAHKGAAQRMVKLLT